MPASPPAPEKLTARWSTFDAGLLNDYGGGDVEWWWGYVRSLLVTAHEHYAKQFAALSAAPEPEEAGRGEAVEQAVLAVQPDAQATAVCPDRQSLALHAENLRRDAIALRTRDARPDSGPAVSNRPTQEQIRTGIDLHLKTAALVNHFAVALAEKLAKAERKYGYSDGWADEGWEAECRAHLLEHVGKGDPLDVAAYCAFMWHHQWSTALSAAPEAGRGEAVGAGLDWARSSGWRARDYPGGFVIEAEYSCINGLSAWFALASIPEPDYAEVEMTDGARPTAREVVQALLPGAVAPRTTCETCEGGGEIQVPTPGHPHPNDPDNCAVKPCDDCDGTGLAISEQKGAE